VATQLANEPFRAGHVRFGNFVGAVAQVPMRSDFPAPEAFLYDHMVTPLSGRVTHHLPSKPKRRTLMPRSDATAAHFHGPADADKTADIAVPITGDLKSPVKGSATLTDAQVCLRAAITSTFTP
jgi:hypothetical protein